MGKIAINIATGSLQQQEMIVGIDLGTTNSLVAIIHPESRKPVVLKEYDGNTLVPSIVHFDNTGVVTVGDEAKNYLVTEPQNTIFSVKRLMGKSYNDVKERSSFFSYKVFDDNTESLVKIQVGEKFYSPVELSSYILSELKKRAEHILKTPVTKAVITVPAYFNDAQRQATNDAGKLAGLDVLRIVNEPTAAALAYGLDKHKSGIVAVYDLGGGTFDISILKLSDGIFEVLSTHGDTYLGGDDIDRRLMEMFITQLKRVEPTFEPNPEELQAIRTESERIKIELTTKTHATVELVFPMRGINYRRALSRQELEMVARPIIEKTRKACENALKDANLTPRDIDEVVLVGGSTRMPAVKALVQEIFHKKPYDSLNPDETVALGAAIQADVLAGNTKDILLLDVTPLSLGIETIGGMMSTIIARNTTIPTKATETYTTFADNQTGVVVNVFQGERDFVKDNRHLASFTLKGIPPLPAGAAKVVVQFLIDADGILHVSALEEHTGLAANIEVKPSYGLTDEEVERMLRDSIQHAKQDISARRLTEARTEAERVVIATEKVLGQLRRGEIPLPKDRMNALDIPKIIDDLYALKKAMPGEDAAAINSLLESLEKSTASLAHEIMDLSVSSALAGREVEAM